MIENQSRIKLPEVRGGGLIKIGKGKAQWGVCVLSTCCVFMWCSCAHVQGVCVNRPDLGPRDAPGAVYSGTILCL